MGEQGGGNLNVGNTPHIDGSSKAGDITNHTTPNSDKETGPIEAMSKEVLAEVWEETWARWFADAPVHTSPPPEWAAGKEPAPFVWDEERRAVLRAELDGLYAHLYGLERDELAYILDTFPIVRRKDGGRYGEYRTTRLVLENFDTLEEQFG